MYVHRVTNDRRTKEAIEAPIAPQSRPIDRKEASTITRLVDVPAAAPWRCTSSVALLSPEGEQGWIR